MVIVIKRLIIIAVLIFLFKESILGILFPIVKITLDNVLTNLTSLLGPSNIIWR